MNNKIEDIGVYESKEGYWEIIRGWNPPESENDVLLGEPKDEYRLLFVPNADYSDDDKEIIINGKHLKDLIRFLKQFKLDEKK